MIPFGRIFTALLVCLAARAGAQTNDVLAWLHSGLGPSEYVGVNAQALGSDGVWRSVPSPVNTSDLNGPTELAVQPLRSSVNPAARQIYWRKDEYRDPALARSWYGEIWYYDDQFVYLHSETFPSAFAGDAWDERPDRFRIFSNAANRSAGRVLAPRTHQPGWSYQQTIDTRLCGVSSTSPGYAQTNGFDQINSGTCPVYQQGVRDARINTELVRNWDSLASGPQIAETAQLIVRANATYLRPAPRVWDAALVISQFMQTPDGYARERFVMGFHGGVYHGIIAWDSATGPTMDSMRVIYRTIPLYILSRNAGPMDTGGMLYRSQRDRTLPPPGKPASLTASCIAGSKQVLLRWQGVAGQTGSDIRIDDLSDPWQPNVSQKDTVVDRFPANSYIATTVPGHTYNWWVHAANDAGSSDNTAAPVTFRGCSGTKPAIPAMPEALTASATGDIATLSWSPVNGATSYQLQVGDLVLGNHKADSFIFRMQPGRTYQWSVRAVNDAGMSMPASGASVWY